MILFKTIKWSNFLSTGNVPNTINLNQHNATLITGKNGEGKSTLLDALCFVLFGKPFRNINKNQLINSINRKNCVVELEFETNGKSYKIVRGIKPNTFEIYCNDELLVQDAAVRDYQTILEQQILKLNYKTFTQVVILGSATFVPFMQLTASQRREVIEDILDIKIFSTMNVLLKERIGQTKSQIVLLDQKIASQKAKVETQKRLIAALVASKKDLIDTLEQKIATNNSDITVARERIDTINNEIAVLGDKQERHSKLVDGIMHADRIRAKLKTKVESCEGNKEFFTSHEKCPSCAQHISEEHKTSILSQIDSEIKKHQSKLDDLESTIQKMKDQMRIMAEFVDDMKIKTTEISSLTHTISVLNNQIVSLRREIDETKDESGNIAEERAILKTMVNDGIEQITEKTEMLEQRNLQEVASVLLKDTGIKTAIIKEYLPVMNKLINRYLTAMDFYVKFELDESFNEIIKSRGRDEFTYASFSEGEKRKLDICIMFTWRQLAKMKNSINTNLLILDEVADGSMDTEGVEMMFKLLGEMTDANVFIISHRESASQLFENVIKVEKKGDFSVIL